MTKAEMLRATTNKVNEERANKRKAKHRKLAEKVIHTKLYNEARKGATIAEFVLKRGYSLTYQENKVIKSIKDIKKESNLIIKFHNGEINTTIINIKETKND